MGLQFIPYTKMHAVRLQSPVWFKWLLLLRLIYTIYAAGGRGVSNIYNQVTQTATSYMLYKREYILLLIGFTVVYAELLIKFQADVCLVQ